jgi:2-methylcitrate dehydratase
MHALRLSRVLAHLESTSSRQFSTHCTSAESEEKRDPNTVFLGRNTNQARGIAQFALDFMRGSLGPGPSAVVRKRVELFHTDSVVCGYSALALRTNAPTILRNEALEYPNPKGVPVFGGKERVAPEKAICANSSAVREWDSNGTVFGYNKKLGHTAGEFGHNDFYPVVIAACQMRGLDGASAVRGMILSDEIRGRLAEVFPLNKYKIDHVVHGAIASAATYGAMMGATVDQIESAIGMCVAHYIPWRAIRAGHQLSDSKGASAAISTEAAILSVHRAMKGFLGPADIFRNPLALWRQFEPTKGASPFDLVLTHSGDDFAVMGMHFKLGLYEHQSAGALHGLITLIHKNPVLLSTEIKEIKVISYEPAFSIIGDPAKRDPHTRQSADHSMVFILSRKFAKAMTLSKKQKLSFKGTQQEQDALWRQLILTPEDYSSSALKDGLTRTLMGKMTFEHGGKGYDEKYPDGIPTSVVITTSSGEVYDSGLIMYPSGHARNTTADLEAILQNKFATLASLAVKDVPSFLNTYNSLEKLTAAQIVSLYDVPIISGANPNEVY